MSSFYLCLFLAGFCAFAHTHHVPGHYEGHSHHPSTEGYNDLRSWNMSTANVDITFEFYHGIALENARANIFFSPCSIVRALEMLSLGAKSTTLSQILSQLGFNQSEISEQEIHDGFCTLFHPKAKMELSNGNALFIDVHRKPLKKFLDDAKQFYQADICPTDFNNSAKAMKQINSYLGKKTHEKLVDVIQGLNQQVAMVLINYISFNAHWENPFDPYLTKEDDFFVDENTTVRVPMMNRDVIYKAYYDRELSCKVVQIPYKGSASALFVLPDPGKLKQVEDALGRDVLLKWVNSLRLRRFHLFLPRFSISGSYDLKRVLSRLGITDAFTDLADLTGITGAPNLKVSKAIHKTFLNVHENGIEAASSTVSERALQSPFPEIKFNRPFHLMIFDIDNSLLAIGRVINPIDNEFTSLASFL